MSSAGTTERVAAARLTRRVLSQWKLVLACALIAAVGGFFASSSRPNVFEATSTVQLTDVNLAAVFTSQNLQQPGFDAQTKAATSVKLVLMPRVRAAAARMLGGRVTAEQLAGAVSVTSQTGTTLLDIKARSENPVLAAAIANAMRSAFIETQQSTATAQLAATRQRVRDELSALPPDQRAGQAGDDLRYRLGQIDTLRLGTGAGVSTVQVAAVPKAAVGPRPKRDAIVTLILGGLIGLGVALLRARLDDHIRDEHELGEAWSLPVLGMIPRSRGLDRAGRSLPPGATMEAFALARTNLRYLHVQGESGGPVIITSSVAGEGKSTVSWNLALAAAMAGTRVLLVDADLRRPVLGARLGVAAERGFSEVLAGMAQPRDVIRAVPVDLGHGGGEVTVDLMPAGFIPPSPIQLLERTTTADILDRLAADYELVLIDTPPATVVADAKVLLERAGGAIVVSRLGIVTTKAFERLRDLLSTSDTPVLGVVVNDATSGAAEYESYYSVGRQADGPSGTAGTAAPPSGARGGLGAKPPTVRTGAAVRERT